jgi:beta-xylosidase
MTDANNEERFSAHELEHLQDELQGNGLDSWQAAELISAFLVARGYGVSSREARTAASRIEAQSCSLETMQRELGLIARVM